MTGAEIDKLRLKYQKYSRWSLASSASEITLSIFNQFTYNDVSGPRRSIVLLSIVHFDRPMQYV